MTDRVRNAVQLGLVIVLGLSIGVTMLWWVYLLADSVKAAR